MFDDNIIKFEAAFDTPMKDAFGSISLDRQVDLLDVVVEDVKRFAKERNIEVCRKTWTEYRKQANWQELAKEALTEKESKVRHIINKYGFNIW